MTKLNENKNAEGSFQAMKKAEFWTGLATVLIILLIAIKLVPMSKIIHIASNQTTKVISPISNEKTFAINKSNPSLSIKPSVIIPTVAPTRFIVATVIPTHAENKEKNKMKAVSVLADTNGKYIVEEGDNYYKISLKVCNSGIYFESIQAANNSQPLHKGDELIVNCSE